jgi:hypothetical protein
MSYKQGFQLLQLPGIAEAQWCEHMLLAKVHKSASIRMIWKPEIFCLSQRGRNKKHFIPSSTNQSTQEASEA